jgi:hypothetical protein
MNALIFEKASSMGLKSGEYGGKNSTLISSTKLISIDVSRMKAVIQTELTEVIGKLKNAFTMMYASIIHYQDT